MIWFALLPALLIQQPSTAVPSAAIPSSQQLYARPLVRPFEPASNFGRVQAQGDDESEVWRQPLLIPAYIDSYRHQYETSPEDQEIAYDQAVSEREMGYDDHMGPLDGRWTVTNADGETVASLVLTDSGVGRVIEGAWTRPARPGLAGDLEPIQYAQRDAPGRVSVWMGDAGTLTLSPTADGEWVGVHQRGDLAEPVVLRRRDRADTSA